MTDTKKPPALQKCFDLIGKLLEDMPNHELFQYLHKQLKFIDENLNAQRKLSGEVFEKLNIGVICAKELESTDPEFCDAVYKMLDEVGPKIVWDFDVD